MIMMTQECFADLEESEQLMMAEQEASEGALTMTVVRAPVLRDSSSYVHDYAAGGRRHLLTLSENFFPNLSFFSITIVHCPGAEGEEPSYHIIPPSDCENIASVFIDRQQVTIHPLSTGYIICSFTAGCCRVPGRGGEQAVGRQDRHRGQEIGGRGDRNCRTTLYS